MATVSGRVIFDRDRSATITPGDSGIANLPVVLQDTSTNVGLVVLTDINGDYEFIDIPHGDYRLVEAFGTPGGVPTPGNFNNAVVLPFAIGANPPISFATNPPTGSTNLDSVTPDTLLVEVTGNGLTNQDFFNGPVIYTPIQSILDSCVTVSDINIIDAANNGTFGFFSQGTPANTGAPVEPYPGVTPDFTYVLPNPATYTPFDGEYTVQNIMNDALSNTIGAWWRIADHTTGNETGRMMVVNGFEPGAIFFRDIVAVQPNTNYLFTSWILNLFKVTGYPNPALGVRIIGQNGDILYNQTLGVLIPVNTNAPEWKEIGTVINSRNNTNITVEFISEGPAAIGNDYAIDDISLNEVDVPLFVPVKTISTPVASVGDTVTFTVTLEDTCSSPLTDVFFKDIVPDGLEFLPESVTINGSPDLNVDPNTGFILPDIPGGGTTKVTFNALVVDIPAINPTPNEATITYSYTPVEGGIPAITPVDSNTVLLDIRAAAVPSADVSVVKTASANPVTPGEVITYTLFVENVGLNSAENVTVSDNVSSSILAPEFSINGGATFNPWPGSVNLGTVPDGTSRTILIRGTVSQTATGCINNAAIVTSTTPDPNLLNNSSSVCVEVEAAVPSADVSVEKTASANPVTPGEVITYTLFVENVGPNAAENVTVSDNVSSSILAPEFSTNGGATFNPWSGSVNLGTVPAGTSRTILIRGTVSQTATGCINNTAIVDSTTPDPDLLNNASSVCVEVQVAVPSADVSVMKTASANPVTPGEVITYTLFVENIGPNAAENVTVSDNVSSSILAPEFSINGGATFNPWPGSVNLGTVPAGTSRTILIRGTVSSTATGCINNAAIVTSTTPDPDLLNNSSSVCVEVQAAVPSADVSVMKTASANPVTPGEVITYTLFVENVGPNAAENVTVSDNVSSSILAPEFSINGGATFNPWPGSVNLGTVPAGTSRTILIRGTVSQTATGCINNTAIVTSTTPDPNLLNNSSSVCVEVEAAVPSADVSVVKTASANPVTPGEVITYTLFVENVGPNAAENVTVSDNVSSSIVAPEFSINGGATFNPWPGSVNLGTVPAGTSRTILIRGTVSSTATGCINNTAIVDSTTPDPDLLNNASSVCVEVQVAVPSADVSVMKTASTNPVTPGEVITYTLFVENVGPNAAENVTVSDNVSSSILAPEFSINGGATFNPWPGSVNLGTVPAGTSRTILIRGTVSQTATGCINNTAIVTSTTPDPNLLNNSSSVCVEVEAAVPSADVSVVKTASSNIVTPGGTITYTLFVENVGPNAAENVTVSDNVSSSIVAPEFSINGGATFNPWPGSVNLGTVPSGTSRTILIRGTASQTATGCINNTAIVTSTTSDPNLLNNSSSVCVEVQAAVPSADVSVVKTASANPVTPGEVITYTLFVENVGPNAAENVTVSDNVSPSILAPEFSINGGATFNPWPGSVNLGTVPAGTSRTILIRGTVSQTATGCINNAAIVTSTTPDPNLLNNSSSVCVEVEAAVSSADVSVVKTASANPVTPGEVITYTLFVENIGPNAAENVTVSDNVSSSILAPEFSINGGATFNPWPGSVNLGTLLAGTSRTILIRGTVSQTATGCINNTAIVTSTTPDPNLLNNSSSICVEVQAAVPSADVSVVKTASSNIVTPGGTITYTLLVSNAGPNAAENVTVSDNVSPSIVAPEFSINGGATFNPWPGSVNLGTVPAGTSRTILIRGTVSQTAAGCINNTAIVTSTTPDPNLLNNSSSICVEVQAAAALADVSVVKTASPNPVVPGEVITYTLVVSNAGPNDAQNVIVNDNVSPSIIGPEFSTNGGVTFNPWPGSIDIGTLPAGTSRTILIRGTVSPTATGCINNTAIVTSTTPDPNLLNNTSSICVEVQAAVTSADVSVVKTASPNPVVPGEVITYTLVVSNAGPNDAQNVIVNDNISPSIIGPEFSTNGGVTFNPWPGSFNIGTLPAGTSRTILIRGTVSQTATGCINNTAIVTSTTPDPNLLNNTSSICVEVQAAATSADVSVVKKACQNPVVPGEKITFKIVVSNAGPNAAENVVLIDNISPCIIGPKFSINGGVTFNPWPGSFNIGTLPAGTSKTILIRGRVSLCAKGCIANAATVTSTTPDPNPLNNTSSICVRVHECADICVKKKCSICSEKFKNIVTFKIRVTNLGPSHARDVILEDKLPREITDAKFSIDGCIECEPWRGCLNIGTLKAGESITIIIEGILRSTGKRKIINTAKVCSKTCDPDLTNNTSSVCIRFNGYDSRNRCESFECDECFECNECSKHNECFECDEFFKCNECECNECECNECFERDECECDERDECEFDECDECEFDECDERDECDECDERDECNECCKGRKCRKHRECRKCKKNRECRKNRNCNCRNDNDW